MTVYIARRLLGLVPTLVVITVIVFLLMHALPGDVFETLVYNPKIKDASELYKRMVQQNGLDQALPIQYIHWVGNLLRGDLGVSYSLNMPVAEAIGIFLPNTFVLALSAEVLTLALSVPIGLYQAKKSNGRFDMAASLLGVLLYSIPGFLFALLLLYFFSFELHVLPASGTVTPGVAWSGSALDRLAHLLLPALALALPSLAFYARLTRSSALAVLSADFVRTARAKGLKNSRILIRHVLRNAMIPIITQFGFDIGTLFGGAVMIEQIFTWPGMGELALNATLNRDYPLILGTTLLFAVMVLVGNVLADILLALSDPRVRLDS